MPFPWGQPVIPPSFVCPHCNSTTTVFRDAVVVCDCSKSLQQEAVNKEREKSFRRERDKTRKGRKKT